MVYQFIHWCRYNLNTHFCMARYSKFCQGSPALSTIIWTFQKKALVIMGMFDWVLSLCNSQQLLKLLDWTGNASHTDGDPRDDRHPSCLEHYPFFRPPLIMQSGVMLCKYTFREECTPDFSQIPVT